MFVCVATHISFSFESLIAVRTMYTGSFGERLLPILRVIGGESSHKTAELHTSPTKRLGPVLGVDSVTIVAGRASTHRVSITSRSKTRTKIPDWEEIPVKCCRRVDVPLALIQADLGNVMVDIRVNNRNVAIEM